MHEEDGVNSMKLFRFIFGHFISVIFMNLIKYKYYTSSSYIQHSVKNSNSNNKKPSHR